MKKAMTVRLAPYLLVLLLISCTKAPEVVSAEPDPQPPAQTETQEQPIPKVTDVINDLQKPTSLEERFSYTYGYMLYTTLLQQGYGDVSASYFAKGAMDAQKGSGFFTHDEMMQTLYEVQSKLLKIAQEELDKVAGENLKKAEDFLKTNKDREGVSVTDSGLQYQVLVQGNGEIPNEDSIVEVDYQIMLLNGQIVDSSYERGQSSTFQLKAIQVPGFIEGVKLMKAGSKYRFWIHPSLGYGKDGNQNVEPNSLLIVEVELKSVKSSVKAGS